MDDFSGEYKMVKYSIIIPNYDPEHKLTEFLSKCLVSVGKNSEDYEVILISNVVGFPKAVNIGLSKCKGEFIVILNNDIEIKDSKWLEKLSHSTKISGWKLRDFSAFDLNDVPDGACWCMSREIYKKIGGLDEIFSVGYGWEDGDYWMRAKKLNIEFHDAKVKLIHYDNKTFELYHPGKFIYQLNHNKNLFKKKWKI